MTPKTEGEYRRLAAIFRVSEGRQRLLEAQDRAGRVICRVPVKGAAGPFWRNLTTDNKDRSTVVQWIIRNTPTPEDIL